MQNIPSARARLTSTVNFYPALVGHLSHFFFLDWTASHSLGARPRDGRGRRNRHLNSLPGENVDSISFNKSIVETPRSASTISEEMMDRFNMSDIDELVVVTPARSPNLLVLLEPLMSGGPRARHTLGECGGWTIGQLPHAYWRVGSGRHCEGPASPIYGRRKSEGI